MEHFCRRNGLSSSCQRTGTAHIAWVAPHPRAAEPTSPPVTGYRVAWGNARGGPFDLGERLVSAGATTVLIDGLKPGAYCFVVYARAGPGVESARRPGSARQ